MLIRCCLLWALGVLPTSAAETPAFAVREPLQQAGAYADLAAQLKQGGPLAELAVRLNGKLRLPRQVRLRFAECGEPNAFYRPDLREVRVCFELLELFAETLSGHVDDEDQLAEALSGTLQFVALHEVGHALVDVLSLPVTGREEDAVDQLSAWLLIDGKDGSTAVLSAAAAFQSIAEGGPADYSGQHALDEQRYYNMLCWLYGSAPQQQGYLITDWGLPTARAEGCAEEFRQIRQSWSRLLRDQLRAAPGAKPGKPPAPPAKAAAAPAPTSSKPAAGSP